MFVRTRQYHRKCKIRYVIKELRKKCNFPANVPFWETGNERQCPKNFRVVGVGGDSNQLHFFCIVCYFGFKLAALIYIFIPIKYTATEINWETVYLWFRKEINFVQFLTVIALVSRELNGGNQQYLNCGAHCYFLTTEVKILCQVNVVWEDMSPIIHNSIPLARSVFLTKKKRKYGTSSPQHRPHLVPT